MKHNKDCNKGPTEICSCPRVDEKTLFEIMWEMDDYFEEERLKELNNESNTQRKSSSNKNLDR
jgi:hypothetical protein